MSRLGLLRTAPRLGLQPRAPRAFSARPSSSAARSEFDRGVALLDGGNVAAAVGAFQEAARLGDAGGNFYLGLAYDDLIGHNARGEPPVEPDPAAAFRCYERAANAGHAEAMHNLALCYRLGEGVDRAHSPV